VKHSISIFARYADGRGGVCTVFNAEAGHTGPDNITPIGPLDAARFEAHRLVAECGYVDVEVTGYCGTCSGAGQVRRKRSRSMFAMTKCPCCKGKDSDVTIVERMTVVSVDQKSTAA
jgi:hypothetical protein